MTLLTTMMLAMLVCGVTMRAAHGAKLEATFELPDLKGNPYDFTENDVKVTFAAPDGKTITVPAFFDGGHTWRARHSPSANGKHRIDGVTLNGASVAPAGLGLREFDVTADSARQAFVRIDPKHKMRFALDDGTPYYPVGYNLPWRHTGRPPMPPLTESLARMGKSGVNWTRIWMNHWDDKNLDWAPEDVPHPPLGQLRLPAAKQWDEIVTAAEDAGVRVQVVLQHHGQLSTKANPNWQDHPWNQANGGWLERPEHFFSDPKAIALTKAKYRYIVARWGYSPAVMAWELFNEAEYTDAFNRDLPALAKWHADMAAFLREHDVYDHLVTTSGSVWDRSMWPAMDYYQVHVYPPDLISAIATLDYERLDKPYFYGEVGGSISGEQVNPGAAIHRSLWASMMSGSSGAAQYWYWYVVEPQNLDVHYAAAHRFIKESDFARRTANAKPIEVTSTTPNRVALRFGPGTGWGPARQTTFTIKPSGLVEGLGGMSSYLQGNHPKNRKMFPFAEFEVDYAEPGTFAVTVDERTEDGARLELTVEDQPATAVAMELGPKPPATPKPYDENRPSRRTIEVDATIEIRVPAGKHKIRLENTGADWARMKQIALSPYTSELAVHAKGTSDFAVMWIYRRETNDDGRPVTGTLSVANMTAGTYRVVWWDTYEGKRLSEQTASVDTSGRMTLDTPPVEKDVAAWVQRAER